jgi:hypothetical protein
MKAKSGQAITEFVIILPLMVVLMLLPYWLYNILEKKNLNQIAVGNLIDTDSGTDSIDHIILPSFNDSIQASDTRDPVFSSINRSTCGSSSRCKLLGSVNSNSGGAINTVYKVINNTEALVSKYYVEAMRLFKILTGIGDGDSILQVRSEIDYEKTPREYSMLLKASASSHNFRIKRTDVMFHETQSGYRPSNYTRGGLIGIGVVTAKIGVPSGVTWDWGGENRDYAMKAPDVGDLDADIAKLTGDAKSLGSSLKSAVKGKEGEEAAAGVIGSIAGGGNNSALSSMTGDVQNIIGDFMPHSNSEGKSYSKSCAYAFRANNKCNVNLLGIGSSVYAEMLVFVAEIAGVADLIEDIFSGGAATAAKEVAHEALKEASEAIVSSITDEITSQIESLVTSSLNDLKDKLESDIKNEIKEKTDALKTKVGDSFESVMGFANIGDHMGNFVDEVSAYKL